MEIQCLAVALFSANFVMVNHDPLLMKGMLLS